MLRTSKLFMQTRYISSLAQQTRPWLVCAEILIAERPAFLRSQDVFSHGRAQRSSQCEALTRACKSPKHESSVSNESEGFPLDTNQNWLRSCVPLQPQPGVPLCHLGIRLHLRSLGVMAALPPTNMWNRPNGTHAFLQVDMGRLSCCCGQQATSHQPPATHSSSQNPSTSGSTNMTIIVMIYIGFAIPLTKIASRAG